MGSSGLPMCMMEFKNCVQKIEVADVKCSGLQYTWNQKPQGGMGILKKLDRVMANGKYISEFLCAHVIFQPYRISDHSPAVLKIVNIVKRNQKAFKFSNFVVHKEGFEEVLREAWKVNHEGHNMFKLVRK